VQCSISLFDHNNPHHPHSRTTTRRALRRTSLHWSPTPHCCAMRACWTWDVAPASCPCLQLEGGLDRWWGWTAASASLGLHARWVLKSFRHACCSNVQGVCYLQPTSSSPCNPPPPPLPHPQRLLSLASPSTRHHHSRRYPTPPDRISQWSG